MARIENNYSSYSSSEERPRTSNVYSSSFFHKDIPSVKLSLADVKPDEKTGKNKGLQIRLLPSFDFSTSYNPELLKGSTLPFLVNKDESDPAKGTIYSEWVAFVRGYSFFGKLKAEFAAPDTLDNRDRVFNPWLPKNSDPINDLRNFIFFNGYDKGTKKYNPTNSHGITPEDFNFVTKQADKKDILKLPMKPRTYAISNALVRTDEFPEWKSVILVYTEQQFEKLRNIISLDRPASLQTIVNPAFSDYYYGDITDKDTGCVLYSKLGKSDLGDMAYISPTMTSSDDPKFDNKSLGDRLTLPVTEEQLQSRYLLSDTDTIDIWSYQRIMDQLIKDPMIPTRLIRMAHSEGAFKEGVELNYHLREKGNETIAKREEAANKAAAKTVAMTNPNSSLPKVDVNAAVSYEQSPYGDNVIANVQVDSVAITEENSSVDNELSAAIPPFSRPDPSAVASIVSDIKENTSNPSETLLEKAKRVLPPEDFAFYETTMKLMTEQKMPSDPNDLPKYFTMHNLVTKA